MNKIKIYGKEYKVQRSQREGKKYKIKVGEREIHFGAKGYRIKPGTKHGDSYCARSSGIKNLKGIDANDASRAMWRCRGKKSLR